MRLVSCAPLHRPPGSRCSHLVPALDTLPVHRSTDVLPAARHKNSPARCARLLQFLAFAFRTTRLLCMPCCSNSVSVCFVYARV
jgi:hypothetical protein